MNIPEYLLYTFVGDFSSNTKEDSLKESILAMVKEHSPVPPEELALSFASAKKGRKLSYATYGSPIKWQKRFLKACLEVGITSIEFVPEPICHMALFTESVAGDSALFSNHRGRVFLSVFRNGLIYDSYFMTELSGDGPIDCAVSFSEFKKAQDDFMNQFSSPLNTMYFVGFSKIQQKSIEEHFKSGKSALGFFDPEKMADIGRLLPYNTERSTLFGLLYFLVKGEKPVGAIIPEEKALKFHQNSF